MVCDVFDRQCTLGESLEVNGPQPRLMVDSFETWVTSAKKHELKEFIRLCNAQLNGRYREGKRRPKYGNHMRWMTPEALCQFFDSFKPEEFKWRVLFATQFYLGLRIGEVVQIKLSDLDFQTSQCRICTEKSSSPRFDSMYMNPTLVELLRTYLRFNESKCLDKGGWLFPAKEPFCATPHVSPFYLRKVFRAVCARAGLDKVYADRSSLNGFESHGQLHLYTTHSLRHSCGNLLRKNGVPIEVVKAILRHASIMTTQIYFRADKEEADAGLKKVFG